MTDAIISVVVEQLASFVQQEVKLILSVRKDVNALTSTLQMLQAVLRDAETRQIKEEAVRLWLDKLKAIVYDAEDVLDEWNTRNHNSLIQGVDDDVHLHKKVFFCCLSPCFSTRSVVVRYDIGRRIKDIKERLDDIANEKEKFKLNESQIHEETRERQTWPMVDVPHTYGREQDKIKLVNLLSGESSAQAMNTNVISIVGTGGFGKTTLAKLVLEEQKVKEIFEKRIFVCVSEPFQLLEIARSIIEQIDGKAPSVFERVPVLQCLCDNLKGKRFLIVLDDVWTEVTNDWDPLKLAFDGGAQGSWVIVTTRSEKVAEMMHSYTHNLDKLSDYDSWLLFEHIAFAGRQEELSKFKEIGKKIVAKCKGVPLAIKIVGNHMRSMKTKKEWNDVLTSEMWEIENIVKEISPSFFLSYNPLPSNLKQCFMYCAIFPKDAQLYKNDLVKLWMAQGFLGSGGNRNLEKIGCDCFDNLAMHSFFQDFERSPDGNIISCKMHDLVHDFALFLTKGEYSFLEVGKELEGKIVRHLVTESLESPSIFMAKNLRTLLITTRSVNSDQLIKIFNQLKRIRILDLSKSRIEELPRQVKELLHLRYLDLSGSYFKELPETICHLFNLQTLKLNRCGQLIKLPGGIGKLLNLRHLELEETDALNCMPRGIVKLRYLRSLSKFIVGNASDECKISELNDFRYLQGSLMIIGFETLADGRKAAVDILSLVFKRLEEGESENLQPREDVEELNIRGSRFPSWISNRSMLDNLLRLTLSECDYTTKLPALGNLASLEELTLKRMKSVKHIGREFYGLGVAFPKLKKLEIEEMNELVEWELPIARDNKKIMPSLSGLKLSNCPMLRALPGLGKLESLEHLEIRQLSKVKYIGQEFYGFDNNNDTSNPCVMVVAFPQLKVLEIEEMNELVEWELPIARDKKKIMPCLSVLKLWDCPMLRALPGLGTLEALESLKLSELPMIKQVGFEFLGISAGDEFVLLFPKLTELRFSYMNQWEVWILPPFQEDIQIFPRLTQLEFRVCQKLRALPDLTRFKSLEILSMGLLEGLVELQREEGISFPGSLRELTLWMCTSLRVIPGYLFPHTLRKLYIRDCPQLRGVQPCLPPLLESLVLRYDVGVFSESLPIAEEEEENNNNNYPNLKKLIIWGSKHPSLPKGFNHLTAIQFLQFWGCESLDFDLNELKHLTMLQSLWIEDCPILAKRFQSSGDDWMTILSHVPNILIDYKNIRESN